jgi:hypothetical protein
MAKEHPRNDSLDEKLKESIAYESQSKGRPLLETSGRWLTSSAVESISIPPT